MPCTPKCAWAPAEMEGFGALAPYQDPFLLPQPLGLISGRGKQEGRELRGSEPGFAYYANGAKQIGVNCAAVVCRCHPWLPIPAQSAGG